jgi:hypothetical protein
MIDHTLEKYKEAVNNENNIQHQQQQQQQQQQKEYEEEEKELLILINNIFNELDKKRKIAINKNDDKDLLRDQIESYRMEEITLDYILYIILEFAGKLI